MLRLALLSTAWLAVTGAAPPQPQQNSEMHAVAECQLPPEAARAAIRRFEVDRRIDRSQPPGRSVNSFYKTPPGFRVHGFPLVYLASADILTTDEERFLLMATVDAPYDDVERAVLAAHGLNRCEMVSPDQGRNCGFALDSADGWRIRVVIKQFDDSKVGIACSFLRDPG